MPGGIKKDIQLEIGHVLFIDIVGYSKRSINEQRGLLDRLNQIVRSTQEFRSAEAAGAKWPLLRLDDLKPCMQMRIQYNLKAADGTQVRNVLYHTINVVGNLRGEVHVGDYRIVETK